jgi:hypothetical protein
MRSLNHAGFDSWGIEPIPMFRDKAIEKGWASIPIA